jgi:hypothetical protein
VFGTTAEGSACVPTIRGTATVEVVVAVVTDVVETDAGVAIGVWILTGGGTAIGGGATDEMLGGAAAGNAAMPGTNDIRFWAFADTVEPTRRPSAATSPATDAATLALALTVCLLLIG